MNSLSREILEAVGWIECTPKFVRCLCDFYHGAHWMSPDGSDANPPDLDDLNTLYAMSDEWAQAQYADRRLFWTDYQLRGDGIGSMYSSILRYEDKSNRVDIRARDGSTRVEARQKAWLAAIRGGSDG